MNTALPNAPTSGSQHPDSMGMWVFIASELLSVSYTHLTLPTNREV